MATAQGKARARAAESKAPSAGESGRRQGREGSRWINVRPTGEDVAAWFKENVPIEDGLHHEDYVSGITMIQQTEKSKEVVAWSPEGKPVIAETSNLVYVPYAKVETRVKYFHDLMALRADKWVGQIEPVEVEKPDPTLPPGFFWLLIPTGRDQGVRFICCSMKVTVFKAGTVTAQRYTIDRRTGEEAFETVGEIVIDAPPATKMIPVSGQRGVDNFSLMKAETGAVGRALGLAGMLIIPGTGVATAEDMAEAEALDRSPAAPTAEEAETPADPAASKEAVTELRQQALVAIHALKADHPEAFATFQEWAKGRGIGKIAEIADERMLRGLVAKAERELQDARAEAEADDGDAG